MFGGVECTLTNARGSEPPMVVVLITVMVRASAIGVVVIEVVVFPAGDEARVYSAVTEVRKWGSERVAYIPV